LLVFLCVLGVFAVKLERLSSTTPKRGTIAV